MSPHINETNGISYELCAPYCTCDYYQTEPQWSQATTHCTICGHCYPSEDAIRQALNNSNMKSIGVLCKRKYKKTNIRRTKVEAVLAEGLNHPNVKALMDRYDTDTFRSVVTRLWKREQFNSDYTTPSVECDLPEHGAEDKPIGEKATEGTPEQLDWEVLAPTDVPAEDSAQDPEEEALTEAVPTVEVPAAYEGLPEEELPTAEACPVEGYDEDLSNEAKPTEVEKTWEGDCIQEEQGAIYLPFSSQHKLMAFLQNVLEGACFDFGQRRLSTLLQERDWNCVEAVPLRTWVDQLASIRHLFDTIPSEHLLELVGRIQDIAVNRVPTDSSKMKKFLDDAVELTEILKTKDHGDIIREIQQDIGSTTEGLSRGEQEAEYQQEKKLKLIAEERRKLNEREAEVRKNQKKSKKECQKSAEFEVRELLKEAKESLETTTFFVQLAKSS